jgi:hypothetical protein
MLRKLSCRGGEGCPVRHIVNSPNSLIALGPRQLQPTIPMAWLVCWGPRGSKGLELRNQVVLTPAACPSLMRPTASQGFPLPLNPRAASEAIL